MWLGAFSVCFSCSTANPPLQFFAQFACASIGFLVGEEKDKEQVQDTKRGRRIEFPSNGRIGSKPDADCSTVPWKQGDGTRFG